MLHPHTAINRCGLVQESSVSLQEPLVKVLRLMASGATEESCFCVVSGRRCCHKPRIACTHEARRSA